MQQDFKFLIAINCIIAHTIASCFPIIMIFLPEITLTSLNTCRRKTFDSINVIFTSNQPQISSSQRQKLMQTTKCQEFVSVSELQSLSKTSLNFCARSTNFAEVWELDGGREGQCIGNEVVGRANSSFYMTPSQYVNITARWCGWRSVTAANTRMILRRS